jgi:DSBA-like thioredoxin domain.
MSLIIYADFSCPSCYLASRRADALVAAGAAIDWRAVEHHRPLPVTGQRLDDTDREALARQLAVVTELLLPGEPLPHVVPTFVPRTEAAVSAYAEAHGAGVAGDVRRLLFDLYWVDGADIGNPTVLRTPLTGPILRGHSDALPLRESGFAVSLDGGPVTTQAYRLIRTWRTEREGLGTPDLPVVVEEGGQIHTGVEALRWLGELMVARGVAVAPELPDPRRYPEVSVRPSTAGWVSETGATWMHALRVPVVAGRR